MAKVSSFKLAVEFARLCMPHKSFCGVHTLKYGGCDCGHKERRDLLIKLAGMSKSELLAEIGSWEDD